MKIKNKGLSIVLAMVVLAIAIPSVSSTTPATPEDVSQNTLATVPTVTATTISIASQTVSPGGTVTVPIMANGITNVAAYAMSLTYNPAVVVVNSVGPGALGGVTANINNATGVTQMNAFSTTPLSGNVVLANVVLRAVGTAGQTSPLTLTVTTLVDNNGIDIPAGVSSGTFSITLATVPTVTITDAHLSTSSTGAPVTTFKRGQTIFFILNYKLSATGNVARLYSNIDWPDMIPGTIWASTMSQPAGTYSYFTSFTTSTSIPAGTKTALMEVAVSGGNLQFKTIKYNLK